MKTKTYGVPVARERICVLQDPANEGHKVINAYVKISDLPLNLPTDVNPRAQNTESRVSRQIQSGLLENSDVFHLLNRGLTITAYAASYDGKNETLHLELASGFYGLVDGGHTYAIIKKNMPETAGGGEVDSDIEKPEFLEDGYVKIQVFVGVKGELLVDIARSLNTSAQVKDESLANLEGSFDWLKDILSKTSFGDKVAYRENEDDTLFPIDIREIVALLTLFHPKFAESETPPIMGYTSKGRCLDLFRNDTDSYQMLRPIIPDILRLYDYIHSHFETIYRDIGGFKGLDEDRPKSKRGVKLAKVSGVRHFKDGFPLFYLGDSAHYLFSDGWLLPVLSSLRAIVNYKTVAKWKVDPFKFFDKVGKGLVQMTLERSVSLGRNPNAVGKDKAHWMALYGHNQTKYMRLAGVDTEKEVVLQ